MTLISLIVLSFGLSMDATAVATTKGFCTKRKALHKHAFAYALCFGIFQGVMPLIGYALGVQFSHFIQQIDHWIAFLFLGGIGLNMILDKKETTECPVEEKLSIKQLLVLGVATSIDALTIGITFAFLHVSISFACFLIFMITFICSLTGFYLGQFAGDKLGSYAEKMGGVILIILGFKILIEHVFLS